MKRASQILLFITFSLLLAFGLVFLLHRKSNRIIAQWKQANTVNYKSFDPYFISVVEGDIDWSSFPVTWERHYQIYVGREDSKPSYGHFIEFSFHNGFDDTDTHIKKSVVEWSDAGITFKEASGHVLFIPKEMFIGGR